MTHLPHTASRARALLLIGLALTLVLGCSSEKKTPATTTSTAPAKPKNVDPYAAAMKAEMEQKRKKSAQNGGERAGLHVAQQTETFAESLKPAEAVAENTDSANNTKEAPVGNPSLRKGKNPKMRDGGPGGPTGTMSTSDLSRTFRKYQNGLQNCYERGLKRSPSIRGKVKLVLTINTQGKVANVSIGQNTLGDAGVTSCMTGQARRWVFPKPEGGKVTVAKTFIFAPQT